MNIIRSILVASGFLFFACTSNEVSENKTNVDKDSLYLEFQDSLFQFTNVSTSNLVKQLSWSGYTDSTEKTPLVRLDSMTVVKLLCPLNVIKTGEYSHFLTSYYYISKQSKIGNVQPIIIWGVGDDYSHLILLTIDQEGKPIDFYTLHKQECSGTFEVGDSLMAICPVNEASIKTNKIYYFENTVCFHVDSAKNVTDFARIDSIAFEATILENGKIQSKKTDSVRYNRIYPH